MLYKLVRNDANVKRRVGNKYARKAPKKKPTRETKKNKRNTRNHLRIALTIRGGTSITRCSYLIFAKRLATPALAAIVRAALLAAAAAVAAALVATAITKG